MPTKPEKANIKKTSKHKGKIILFSIIVIVIAVAVTTLLAIVPFRTPTRGEPIANYENPRSALLVIHVQNIITNNPNRGDTREFVNNVNRAITIAEEYGMEILYVQHITRTRNPIALLLRNGMREDMDGTELDSNLQIINDNIFNNAPRGDAFSSRELEAFLIANKIDTLYIVGGDGRGCAFNTALGGANRNYTVNVIADAISIMDSADLGETLDRYISAGVSVIDLAQFEQLVKNR